MDLLTRPQTCRPVVRQSDIAFPNSNGADNEKEKRTGSPDPLGYAVLVTLCSVHVHLFVLTHPDTLLKSNANANACFFQSFEGQGTAELVGVCPSVVIVVIKQEGEQKGKRETQQSAAAFKAIHDGPMPIV
jgi:hypothetical protein